MTASCRLDAGRSPQPRAQVRGRVAELLEDSGRDDRWGYVVGFTHAELAECVYGTDSPTPAQLSAVRRAVARLVADGRAVRGSRAWGESGRCHERVSKCGVRHWALNPGGIVIFRVPTAEDEAAAAAWQERHRNEITAGLRRFGLMREGER